MKDIIFTDTLGVLEEFKPVPASKLLPEWYKNTNTYINGKKQPMGHGETSATIKRCMPVLDVLSHGYLILTYTDIWVNQKIHDENNKETWFQWSHYEPISFHPLEQAPIHPSNKGGNLPKWVNPWSIRTPIGYSTLFIPPVHRNNVFSIFEGVVDTDSYFAPVNFPMSLTDKNFEGLIPAGTPIAQVIPFLREEWQMSLGQEKDKEIALKDTEKIRVRFFDSYKKFMRHPKVYK